MGKQGSRLFARLTNTQHPKCDVQEFIASHPISSNLQVIYPSDAGALALVGVDGCFHVGQNLRLGDVVKELVESGAFNGNSFDDPTFAAVGLGPAMDRHGGIAITPDGQLHMAVSSELHEQLGLVGSKSAAQPDERYNIRIKLNAQHFQPGKPFHDKVVRCLNQQLGPCTLAATWRATSDQPGATTAAIAQSGSGASTNSPSWVQDKISHRSWAVAQVTLPTLSSATLRAPAPVHKTAAATVEAMSGLGDVIPLAPQPAASTRRKGGSRNQSNGARQVRSATPTSVAGDAMEVDAPDQPPQQGTSAHQLHVARGLHEWLGALSCGLQGTVCNSLLPEQLKKLTGAAGTVHISEWTGLILHSKVAQQLREAEDLVGSGTVPWAVLAVWGWADSPLAWTDMEHSTHHNMGLPGVESHYMVVVMAGGDILMIKALGEGEWPCSAAGSAKALTR